VLSPANLNELISARGQLAGRHDAAWQQWPSGKGPPFGAELGAVAEGLASIAAAIEAIPDAPAIEKARSWMWFGDAWLDLARYGHRPFDRELEAYERARPHLKIAGDEILLAKFRANRLGMVVANPRIDLQTLEEAIREVDESLPVLNRLGPESMATVTTRRRLAEEQRKLMRTVAERHASAKAALQPILALLDRKALRRGEGEASHSMIARLAELPDLPTSVGDGLAQARIVRELLGQLTDAAGTGRDPSLRSTQVFQLASELWQRLRDQTLRPDTPDGARQAMDKTMKLLTEVRTDLDEAGRDDARTLEIESTRLRPIAARSRELLGRGRLTSIAPLWHYGRMSGDANAVYLTGRRQSKLVVSLCAERRLQLLPVDVGEEAGDANFEAIRQSAVVIADLTDKEELAATCYRIGLALALGRPLVVLAEARSAVPFDIDLVPIELSGGARDRGPISQAIDRALLLPQRHGMPEDRGALARRLRRAFPDPDRDKSFLLAEFEREQDQPDRARAVLEELIGTSGLVAHPTWPLPEENEERRLFHVMPFTKWWSTLVRTRARRACLACRIHYRRHDDVPEARIIQSLWVEICRASHVLVDLTGMNPNVLLELGLVHAIGKRCLLVGRVGTRKRLFPELRRTTVEEYRLLGGRMENAIANFIQRSPGTGRALALS